MDCKNRSFRYNNVTSSLCPKYNETQDVYHVKWTLFINIDRFLRIDTPNMVRYFARRSDQDKVKKL